MQYLELFLAALAAFLVGFLWYTALFGKVWQRETGITDEDAKSGMALTHGVAFLMMYLIAYFTYSNHINDGNAGHGAFHAMMSCLKFAIPLLVINYMYQKKSFVLILIDAGYAVVFFCVIGAMIALLPIYESPTPSLEDAQQYFEYYNGKAEGLKEIIDGYNSGN